MDSKIHLSGMSFQPLDNLKDDEQLNSVLESFMAHQELMVPSEGSTHVIFLFGLAPCRRSAMLHCAVVRRGYLPSFVGAWRLP